MAFLLSFFLSAMILMETLKLDVGLAPGLTLRNGMLYVIAVVLILRFTISREFKIELGWVLACFSILVIYALASTLVAGLLVQYPRYDLMNNLMLLKRTLFDFMLGFTIFFYATKTEKDALSVLKACLAVAVFTNVVSVLHGLNVIHLATISEQGGGGARLQGIMGEHNQNGAFLALFIPPLVAAAASSTGAIRFVWIGGILTALAGTLMSASRGGIAGTVLSALWGAYVFRRHISLGKMVAWSGVATMVVLVIVIALSAQFSDLLEERFIGQSRSVDSSELSSGRTAQWALILKHMMREPITFLTGYGWQAYEVMPFRIPPHNSYLGFWFGLGLPGLLSFVLLFVLLIQIATRSVDIAKSAIRPHLMGFAVGAVAFAIAIFFVEVYVPWPFFWAYAGIVMRLAVISSVDSRQHAGAIESRAKQTLSPVRRKTVDPFGWTARDSNR